MEKVDIRYLFLPYCLKLLADGRYIILNRRYKPLGVQTREWVDYDGHPTAAQIHITPAKAKRLSWRESDDVKEIFLYNDGSNPMLSAENMRGYQSRLAILMSLVVEVPL